MLRGLILYKDRFELRLPRLEIITAEEGRDGVDEETFE
jgi:hypothetical protein